MDLNYGFYTYECVSGFHAYPLGCPALMVDGFRQREARGGRPDTLHRKLQRDMNSPTHMKRVDMLVAKMICNNIVLELRAGVTVQGCMVVTGCT